MSLAPGVRLGPYEVLTPLGAGGMGEVYKAKDTRLDRTVAIKTLPAHVAADPDLRQRFEREARAVAALSHPHICTLYDIGNQDGVDFLVMEYLEGETLADRLARGADPARPGLPTEEALRYAIEIAGALDAAHRAGIVHRDLKPANIFLMARTAQSSRAEESRMERRLSATASVKLLDFGLAKTSAPVVATSGLSMLPTTPPGLTVKGTILGTFQYMAPEQIEGQEADARTDIFAFGAVLYEMVTGRKAFQGKTQASLLGAIMQADPPPVASLQPLTPPSLDRVIRKCLAKDPDLRWQSARDLQDELQWIADGRAETVTAAVTPSAAPRRARERAAWAIAAVCAVAAITSAGWLWLGRSTTNPAKVSFDIITESAPNPLQIALSPDAARLAAFSSTPQGNAIWLRRLDEVGGQILAGTTGAAYPFWSPDGRFLAFFASGKLNKIDVFGGPAQPLCDAPSGLGGTWNRAGAIVFAPANGPLFTVPAAGGIPVQVTELDKARGDTAHRHPKFLPDGRHFLFYLVSGKPENTGLYLGAMDSKETTRLVASDAMGVFAPPDHLLFMRDTTLMAQRFDPRRLELQGDPFPAAQGVGINTGNSVSGIAVSDTGVLAYRLGGGASDRVLQWVDRSGMPLGEAGATGAHENVSLAPGGDRLVETRLDGTTGDIWVADLTRGSSSRFTFDPALDDNAIWSPDGSQIVFASSRDGGVRNLYIKSAGGAGQEELLLKTDASKFPTDWSRDGQYILYTELMNGQDVWVLPLSGDKKPMPFLQTPFPENRARFSADGRWIAYTSYESGQGQVYVQSFPPSGGKWQISTAGGVEPHWRGDGRELFYIFGGAMWAVDVTATNPTSFTAGVPRKLFDAVLGTGNLNTRYDVTRDGQRFLLNGNSSLFNAVPPIRIVVNWMTGLQQ
jgi:serine/threonine protein kinase/Tol biopolymer transport system component